MNFIKKIPKSIDNAIQNITDEPTQSIGTLIKDAIYLRFGHISYDAKKRRLFEKYGLLELEKLPDGPDKERRIAAISPIRQMHL